MEKDRLEGVVTQSDNVGEFNGRKHREGSTASAPRPAPRPDPMRGVAAALEAIAKTMAGLHDAAHATDRAMTHVSEALVPLEKAANLLNGAAVQHNLAASHLIHAAERLKPTKAAVALVNGEGPARTGEQTNPDDQSVYQSWQAGLDELSNNWQDSLDGKNGFASEIFSGITQILYDLFSSIAGTAATMFGALKAYKYVKSKFSGPLGSGGKSGGDGGVYMDRGKDNKDSKSKSSSKSSRATQAGKSRGATRMFGGGRFGALRKLTAFLPALTQIGSKLGGIFTRLKGGAGSLFAHDDHV